MPIAPLNNDPLAVEIRHAFDQLFASKKPQDEAFHQDLVETIVHCFHIQSSKLWDEKKALLILDCLFTTFQSLTAPSIPFSLDKFIITHIPKKTETRKFIIALLYGLYFRDIDLKEYQGQNFRNNIQFFMFQLLAETVSTQTLQSVLKGLPFDMLLTLICYAIGRYREGSSKILSGLKLFEELNELITGLKRNYFDVNLFYKLLLTKPKITPKVLKVFIGILEDQALEETKEAYNKFTNLIPLLINSPHQSMLKENEKRDLESTLNHSPSLQEFHHFTRLFGLRGHNPYVLICLGEFEQRPLVNTLDILNQVFTDPELIPKITQEQYGAIFAFVQAIVLHTHVLTQDPKNYLGGLDEITFAIPTKGKLLEIMPSLPSILSGLTSLVNCINARSSHKVDLKDYPIFVYDQSDTPLFDRNKRFIDKLNRQNKCSIITISKEEAITAARKLGIEPLVNTSGSGEMGFGGARNAVFLLTPILRELYRIGHKTIEGILNVEASLFATLFQKYVLGNASTSGRTILTIDDDMEIPEANIFAHVLFSQLNVDKYYLSFGNNLGRGTKHVKPIPPFEDLLHLQHVVGMLSSTKWVEQVLHVTTLAESLSKPCVFLNLPMGCEETHITMNLLHNPLLQTSYHLPGTRYPTHKLPTHFFVGLEDFLKTYIPYVFHVGLNAKFIDSPPLFDATILPWSDGNFSSLRETFGVIACDKTKCLLQKNFWRKVHEFFIEKPKESDSLTNCLQSFIHVEMVSSLERGLKQEKFFRSEKESLKKIATLYSFYQLDVKLFYEFGRVIIKEIKRQLIVQGVLETENWFECCVDSTLDLSIIVEQSKSSIEKHYDVRFCDRPLIHGFYLLIRAAGLGGFCDIIRNGGYVYRT